MSPFVPTGDTGEVALAGGRALLALAERLTADERAELARCLLRRTYARGDE